jgi:hypothetical protein
MHGRALLTIFLAALVVTASGPAAAYHSAQALPGVETGPPRDDGTTVV